MSESAEEATPYSPVLREVIKDALWLRQLQRWPTTNGPIFLNLICEFYLYGSDLLKGAFSTRHCWDMTLTRHEFTQYENLLTVTFSGKNPKTNGFPIYDRTVMRVEKNNLNKKHTYRQYFCQCKHRIYFMISKKVPLSENYRYMINFIASKF